MQLSIVHSLCTALAGATLSVASLSAQQVRSGFADPARAAKLQAAAPAIDRIMRDFATSQHIPGAAWGIIVDGKLAHIGVTGLRDIAARSPVDSNTVFRIASMTKSFTAMAILKLRDDGKLSLDDPAERYVPELAGLEYPTSDSPRLTIRHLMSHSTGFPEDNPWGDQQLARSDAELSKMITDGIPFSNPPGVAYEYSNYGFAILGRIVTRASGMPYKDYVAANIFRPLGMRSTTLSPGAVPANQLAHGYRWEDEQWKEEEQLPDGAFGSMGGMLTSLSDLGTYVSTFLAAWPPRDGTETGPVKRSSLREMQQVSRPGASSARRTANGMLALISGGYGYGLRISTNCLFEHVVAHSGGLPGFGSQMRWLPEYGVGIITFGNRTYTGWGAPIDAAFAALAATGALQPRMPEPSAALVEARAQVTRLVLNWDDQLAKSIAADNLFLDRSIDRRSAEFAAQRARVGACSAGSGFAYVENALRGQWIVPCERGNLLLSITLAPTATPTVQYMEVRAAPASGVVTRPPLCSGT
ncbi:MAG: serine hydrolase [Gemmatimonadetes bacterium]|nr:serine hydrolase [Gemmatimonadota bacterium]